MSRRRGGKPAISIQLFPFLAVLICTMGALVVLLHGFADHGKNEAVQLAQAAAEEQAVAEKNALEDTQWRIAQLAESRDKTAAQLNEERLKLSHVEDHERRLANKLEQLRIAAAEMNRIATQKSQQGQQTQAELAATKEKLARSRRDVDQLRQKGQTRSVNYSVVPYDGPNATSRRPIYIECRENLIILQPEGIELMPQDFIGFFGPGNPLASALRGKREYYARQAPPGTQPPEPYPLLLVRPEGIQAYYAARAALDSWGSDFGYEMIGSDWKLAFPESEPQLKSLTEQVVDDARLRHREYIMNSPQVARANRTKKQYHARARGGFAEQGGGGSGGSGKGGWEDFAGDWARTNGGGAGGRDGRGGLEDEGRGDGGSGTGRGNGYGTGGGTGDVANGYGSGPGGSGSDARGQGGSGFGSGEVGSGGTGSYPGGNGAYPGGVGSGPGGTGSYAGGNGSYPGNGTGHGTAGNGGASGNGQPNGGPGEQGDAGDSLAGSASEGKSNPWAQPGGGGRAGRGVGVGQPQSKVVGSGLPGNGGSAGGEGDSGEPSFADVNSSGQSAGGSGSRQGKAGNGGASGRSKSYGPSSGYQGNATGSGAGGGPSSGDVSSDSGQGGNASGPPSVNVGSQASPHMPKGSGKKRTQSMAGQRGRDWGLPDGSDRATPAIRPVLVECHPDRLVVVSQDKAKPSKEIKLSEQTQDSMDDLISAVWDHTKSWGTAGKGMIWRPTLTLEVKPGAADRYSDIKALLADSGLDVHERTPPAATTANPRTQPTKKFPRR